MDDLVRRNIAFGPVKQWLREALPEAAARGRSGEAPAQEPDVL
jgi:hypothetical protein